MNANGRDPVELATLWDDWHRARDLLEREGSIPVRNPWREMARELLPARLDGLRVIDIGCARGGFTRDLAEAGADVTAVDLSTVAVELTRGQLGSRRGEVVIADARSLPFPDHAFDVAVCLQTPNHVSEPRRVLAEAARVTTPSGLLIVTIQNVLSLSGLSRFALDLARRQRETPPVTVPLTLPGVLRMIRSLGCRIEAVEGQGHLLVVPGFRTVSFHWPSRYRSSRYVASHACVAARNGAGRVELRIP